MKQNKPQTRFDFNIARKISLRGEPPLQTPAKRNLPLKMRSVFADVVVARPCASRQTHQKRNHRKGLLTYTYRKRNRRNYSSKFGNHFEAMRSCDPVPISKHSVAKFAKPVTTAVWEASSTCYSFLLPFFFLLIRCFLAALERSGLNKLPKTRARSNGKLASQNTNNTPHAARNASNTGPAGGHIRTACRECARTGNTTSP